MALATSSSPWGVRNARWVLFFYLTGWALLYVGERLVGGVGKGRWVVSGLAVVLLLAAWLAWKLAWWFSRDEHRRIQRTIFFLSLGGFAALVLYVISSDLVLGPAAPAKPGEAGVSGRQILQVAWLLLLALSSGPLLFAQWSAFGATRSQSPDARRVFSSAWSGGIVTTLLCTLFFVNALANRLDVNTDLSYFKTTSPSASTRSLVEGLTEDTAALLFFPPANDVLTEVEGYFGSLARSSSRLQVKVIDRAMAPEEVSTYRVSRDGTVVLARGEQRQTIEFGVELDSAKTKLRKLDSEVQTALLKLERKQSTVYWVTGHGERSAERVEGDARDRMSLLKGVLSNNNLLVKPLGAVQGLSSAVPDDAALVMMLGPTTALFPGEAEAIERYLERGGRLLLTLDPAAKAQPEALLSRLGLRFRPTLLASDQGFLVASQTQADRRNIVTDQFSAHAATNMISRYSRELPVAMPESGSLEKIGESKKRVDFICRSLPVVWADADGDLSPGPDEKRQMFQLAAALSAPVEGEAAPPPEKTPPAAAPPKREMRAVVLANSAAFGDTFLPFYGNRFFMADVLRWLVGEGEVAGPPANEEDVRVQHTRGQEIFWFYGTVFAVPVIILGVGFATRFGRGRNRRAAS
ncbi:MAG: hypothetical protein GYA21_13810 [Myxococcales bacterium]|nr:hypothetical protein [Myxococcales bacterium]